MKTIQCLFAALVVAISVLGPVKVQGSVNPPLSFPVSIPTAANEIGLLNQMVSNPIYPGITLFYTDTNGVLHGTGPITTPKSFSSYQAYRDFCTSNILYGICLVKTNSSHPADPNGFAKIVLDISVSADSPSSSLINTNASSLNAITADWLNTVTPSYSFIVIPVPGLQQFTVTVNTGGSQPYVGGWVNTGTSTATKVTAKYSPRITKMIGNWYLTDDVPVVSQDVIGANSVSQYPPEYTRSGWLVLNFWYLLQQYPTRFLIIIGTQWDQYTQFGTSMKANIQVSGTSLQANWTMGANATIEATTNLSSPNWIPFGVMPNDPNATNAVMDLSGSMFDPSEPQMYFRVRLN